MIIRLGQSAPQVGDDAWIAPGARVVGDVAIGAGSSIWYGAVLRADLAAIRIGNATNLQDNCVVHTDSNYPTVLGNEVSVGHNAVVHGATIGDNCLIGMGAIVMNAAVIGARSLVAAGAVVPEGMEVPPGSLVVGVPATVRRRLRPNEFTKLQENAAIYRTLARRHRESVRPPCLVGTDEFLATGDAE